MITRTLLASLLLTSGPLLADAGPGNIRFFNQDILPGSVTAIEKDLIRWSSPELEAAAPFFMNQVLEINQTPAAPTIDAKCEAIVSLTNGDSLRGQLAGVSDSEIELDTWYAGRVTLRRPMVEGVRIIDRPKMIFQGPEGLDGWKRLDDEKAWSFEFNRFKSSGRGQIARDVKMPEVSRTAFDLVWRSQPHFRVFFCSDNANTKDPSNFYELTVLRRSVSLRKHWNHNGDAGNNSIGQSFNVPEFSENEKARVELCIDRKKGVFNLIIDGRSVAVWNDPEFKKGAMGGGLHFQAEDSSPLTLSRIEITEWDGTVEHQPTPENLDAAEEEENQEKETSKKEEPTPGRMTLRNGDTLFGEVLGIEKGIMRVKTSFQELKLPVSRLKTIALKPVEREEAILKNGDVRAWFPDGSRVVFRLDAASPDALQGFSQNFGNASFKPSAFSRVEFNLYDPKFQTLRGEKTW